MFIEINEIGTYQTNEQDNNWEFITKTIIKGKVIINTDLIRCISICSFEWENADEYIIKEGSQLYCTYFDKDRYITTDIESYNNIKKLIINNNSIDYEKI